MAKASESLDELNLSDISGELIRNDLQKIAREYLNSNNVKFYTKHGSKKGMSWHFASFSNKPN